MKVDARFDAKTIFGNATELLNYLAMSHPKHGEAAPSFLHEILAYICKLSLFIQNFIALFSHVIPLSIPFLP
jgi:hypothetical protein